MSADATAAGQDTDSGAGTPISGNDLSRDERRLYAVMPRDGSYIGNGDARIRLAWQYDLDRYWAVRNALRAKSLLVLGRGRGGSIARAVGESDGEPIVLDDEPAPTAGRAVPREHSLYKSILAVLKGAWQEEQAADFAAVEATALQGRRNTGGKWSRPDLVTVEVISYDLVPGRVLEVTTFEVKAADAIDVEAVYEALAHRVRATHAYVLLHVPADLADDLGHAVTRVQSAAAALGIGVVTFGDPGDFKTWVHLEEAQRREPDPEQLNEFLTTQLPKAARDEIRSRVDN